MLGESAALARHGVRVLQELHHDARVPDGRGRAADVVELLQQARQHLGASTVNRQRDDECVLDTIDLFRNRFTPQL